MKNKVLTAIIHKEEDMYVAECPEVGTVDQGETIEEAIANLKEATRLYLEVCSVEDVSPRFVTAIEVSYA
ncbi:type II toxin-antitoxin system HicB family antitoxin [Ancylothrix sp. C2]|uniref:type II toxin-antitoxin system HicB family antitoxin n=1 Tax=Ancylothrix sp. D3o TaxID=2953691 RepID=UPI0021BA492D|nr:type II toxin-antitoxin system HicB family antitoxin [Ancylothrix sp. D3o]MCT7950985.1 type II toxin-antitoxin system HicB family antitoxin [Ancylothrix sp. D3o]